MPEATFDYLVPEQLGEVIETLLLGALLAWWVIRHADPRGLRWLRQLHTGSVNDYAIHAVVGLLLSFAVIVVRWMEEGSS